MSKRLLLLALLAGCASPTTSAVAVRGEAAAAVEADPAPTPVWTPRVNRTVPASRSRQARRSHVGSGSHLSVTCYSYTGNRTASGKWPRVGMAASNRYPFGTRLRVPGVGIVTVEDRIGWGSDLDLYGPSESWCRQFGRRHLRVAVVG